jgi:hypothetical protein
MSVPDAAPLSIADLLDSYRFTYQSEAELQNSISMLLASQGWDFEREVRLTDRDRIDFLIGKLGLEVKIKGSWAETFRQLQRYAASDRIEGLLLVTTKLQHVRLVREIGGKPLVIKWIGAAL